MRAVTSLPWYVSVSGRANFYVTERWVVQTKIIIIIFEAHKIFTFELRGEGFLKKNLKH